MQVATNAVVTIDYTLKDMQDKTLDTSVGKQPLLYLHGSGHSLLPKLEAALEGKKAGDQINVTIAPEDGYGVRDEKLVHRVTKSAFQGVPNVKVGDKFRIAQDNDRAFTVTSVEGENVTVDGNHDLAGLTLKFEITVREVRAATKDELAHGHVHGPGGHHHH